MCHYGVSRHTVPPPHLYTLNLLPIVSEQKGSENLLNIPQETMELWLERAISVVQHAAVTHEDPRTQVRALALCSVFFELATPHRLVVCIPYRTWSWSTAY